MDSVSSETAGDEKATPVTLTRSPSVSPPPRLLSYSIPDKPLVTIEATRSWVALDLADLWAHRELLYFLMWRDVKVRYKQTFLGAAWAIIQPLVTMLIFTYFFGRLARVPTEGVPYPIFFYTGLVFWAFFSNGVTNAANSLIGNTNLIRKVYFPRLLIPAAAVGAGLLDFAIASALLIGLLVYYGFAVTWSYLMLLPLVVLGTLLALGVGIWQSALNVKYRDVRYALPFIIQVWMFVSPIIYPSSLVPEEWRWVMVLNPVTGVVEGFRSALFGHAFNWAALGYSTAFSVILLVYASFAFRRTERSFAELV
jgi:lipopolysaccharide transport system permease protein